MPRIAIVHYGEPSPVEAGYTPMRYGRLARALVDAGCEVERLLPTFAHIGRFHRAEHGSRVSTSHEGTVIHLSSSSYGRSIGLGRLRNLRSFSHQVRNAYKQKLIDPYDLVLVGYPPPGLVLASADLASQFGAKLVVDVRDLWPDAQLSAMPAELRSLETPIAQVIRSRSRTALRRGDFVTAISSDYLRWAEMHRLSGDTATSRVFPIGAPPRQMVTTDVSAHTAVFRVCFVGSLSRHFDVRLMLDGWDAFMKALGPRRTDVVLEIMGSGEQERLVGGTTVQGIIYHGYNTGQAARDLIVRSTVGLAPYRLPSAISLPNKIFEYLGEGLHVISTLHGEAEGALSIVGGGTTLHSPTAECLADALLKAYEARASLVRDKARLRDVTHDLFGADRIYADFANHVMRLATNER